MIGIRLDKNLCTLREGGSWQAIAQRQAIGIVVGIANVGILEHRAIEGSLQYPALSSSDFLVSVRVVAANLDVPIFLFGQDHAFCNVFKVFRMNAYIYCSGIHLAVGGASRVYDSVVVLTRRVGVCALVNATWVTQRIMAVTSEEHDLWVFVQNRVQDLHTPCTSCLVFGP